MPKNPEPPPPRPPDPTPAAGLTAAQREFARVAGRLLADRWRGRHTPPATHPDRPAANAGPAQG